MTNIIIDGLNGIMTLPTADAVYEGLKFLLTHPDMREKIASRGYETVAEAFNLKQWEEKWSKVLASKMK